jgi:hypothetical protein
MCHEVVIHAWQLVYRKQLPFFFYLFYMNNPGISWECKLWSDLVPKSETQVVWVQDGLKRKLKNKDIAQELILDSDSDVYISYDDISSQSDSGSEEDSRTDTGCRDCTDTRQSWNSALVVHKFTEKPSGLRQNEAPNIHKYSSSLSIVMLFFLKIMQLLVEKANRYYHQYLDILDERHFPLPNMNIQKCTFSYLLLFRWFRTRKTDWKTTGLH